MKKLLKRAAPSSEFDVKISSCTMWKERRGCATVHDLQALLLQLRASVSVDC